MNSLILATTLTLGQCPGGSCAAPDYAPLFQPVYQPVQFQHDGWVDLGGGQHALFRGGMQLGNWHARDGYWRAYLGDGAWGEKSPRAPEPPPGGYPADDGGLVGPPEPPGLAHGPNGEHLPTGVDPDRIRHDEPFQLGGKSVSRDQAVQAIVSAGALTDDSAKPFLVLVGPADWCEAQMRLVTPEIAAACHVQEYRPDERIISDVGYTLAGVPRAYLTDAGGKVLWTDKVMDAQAVAGALRKKRPDFDPSKLLDGMGLSGILGALGQVPMPVWVIGVVALLFMFAGKRKAG